MEENPNTVNPAWVVASQREFDQMADDFNRVGSQGGWSGEYSDPIAIAGNGLASLRSANPDFAAGYDKVRAEQVAALPDNPASEIGTTLGDLAGLM